MIKKGEQIQAKNLITLAALGIKEILVKKTPKVIFFGTGNEIADYRKKNIPLWKVRNSNNLYFSAFGKALNLEVVEHVDNLVYIASFRLWRIFSSSRSIFILFINSSLLIRIPNFKISSFTLLSNIGSNVSIPIHVLNQSVLYFTKLLFVTDIFLSFD